MARTYPIALNGPWRGVNAREHGAIAGQFRHLMNCIPARGGIYTRYGYYRDGQAASLTCKQQNAVVIAGLHDEIDTKVCALTNLRWKGTPPDGCDPFTRVRWMWSNLPQGNMDGKVWCQFRKSNGAWYTMLTHGGTSRPWSEGSNDDPNIQQVVLNNEHYFCSGYGPLYKIRTVQSGGVTTAEVSSVRGVNRHVETRGLIPYIMGDLPKPKSMLIYKSNVLVFAGLIPDEHPYITSALLLAPQNPAAKVLAGGSLAIGTWYYKITTLDEEGRESEGSTEVSATVVGVTPILDGLDFIFKQQRMVGLEWDRVSHAATYRVYCGAVTGVYTRTFDTQDASFSDAGDVGTVPVHQPPGQSGPITYKFGKSMNRTIVFFDRITLDNGLVGLKAYNQLTLRAESANDVNDDIVTAIEAFGGIVVFCKRSIHFVQTGENVNIYLSSAESRLLASGIGSESPRSVRMCSDGFVYFVDRKGIYRLTGASAPTEVSAPIHEYFEGGSSLTGTDPFVINEANLRHVHAVEHERYGFYMAWLPMSMQNHRKVTHAVDIVVAYKYKNELMQVMAEYSDFLTFFGKGAYYDQYGGVNVVERGYAFSAASYLDDGSGRRRLYLGGYDGYVNVEDVNYMDAWEEAVSFSAPAATTIRFDLEQYPGLRERNDYRGCIMEILDDGTGVIPSAQSRWVKSNLDKYLHNCDVIWNEYLAAGVSAEMDYSDSIDGRGSVKITLPNSAVPYLIATDDVAVQNVAVGDTVRMWVKSSRYWAAGDLTFVFDNNPSCPTPFLAVAAGEIQPNTWTQVTGTSAANSECRSVGVMFIGAGTTTAGDWIKVDMCDLEVKRYVDFEVESAFLNTVGVATALPAATRVRLWWPINTRIMPMPFGLKNISRVKRFVTLNGQYRAHGEQQVNFIYSAKQDGFEPGMLVTQFPCTNVNTLLAPLAPDVNADGRVTLVEKLDPFWSWTSVPGHRDLMTSPLWFNHANQGVAMYLMMEHFGVIPAPLVLMALEANFSLGNEIGA